MKIKINAVRTMIIASLIIIILYTVGLFLPIIKNTKETEIYKKYLYITNFNLLS